MRVTEKMLKDAYLATQAPTAGAATIPPPNTRRVRIAVACDPHDHEEWDAAGVPENDEALAWETLANMGDGLTQRLAIIEADIPLPTVPTVRGRVAE